jgi:hypothetical protein
MPRLYYVSAFRTKVTVAGASAVGRRSPALAIHSHW